MNGKKRIIAFVLLSVILVAVTFAISSVYENYKSQNKNDVLTYQRVCGNNRNNDDYNITTAPQDFIDEEEKPIGYYYQDKDGNYPVVYEEKIPDDDKYEYHPVFASTNVITDHNNKSYLLNPSIYDSLQEFTFADYENYYQLYDDMDKLGVYGELPETETKQTTVTPVLVNEAYFVNNDIPVEGDYITKNMSDKKQRTAVISRTFAEEHFYGKTAINKTFVLNDRRYIVKGIYDDKNDRLNNLFKDGKERIFINYSGSYGYQNVKVDFVSYLPDSGVYYDMQRSGFKNLERVNFDEKNNSVDSLMSVLFFIIAVFGIVYLMKLWLTSLSSTARFVSEKHKTHYLFGMIRHNAGGLSLRLLCNIGIPCVIAGSLVLSLMDFYIVPNYINTENLFDVPYMINTLISTINHESTFSYGGNPYYINMYNMTLLIMAVLIVVFVILMFMWFYTFTQLDKNGNTRKSAIAGFVAFDIVFAIVVLFGGLSVVNLIILSSITAVLVLKYIRDRIILC